MRPHAPDNGTRYRQKGRRPPPARGWGRRPCGIRRGDCAICGWRGGTIGGVRPLRRATRGAASGLRDLGCPPPVGKSGRRGIFRQSKVRVRSHTGCMARNRTAAMAEKARRAPQTHGRWVALTRKKSSKTFYSVVASCGSQQDVSRFQNSV